MALSPGGPGELGATSAAAQEGPELRLALEQGQGVIRQEALGNDVGADTGDAMLDLDGHLAQTELAENGLPIGLPDPHSDQGTGYVGARPAEGVDRLACDGDTMCIRSSGHVRLTETGWGKAGFRNSITARQIGGCAPGALPTPDDPPVRFDISFDAGLQGLSAEGPGAWDLYPGLISSEVVTLRCASKDEAARAVVLLQRVALAGALRDAARRLAHETELPEHWPSAGNPLLDPMPELQGSTARPGALAMSGLALQIEPERRVLDWLRGHIARIRQEFAEGSAGSRYLAVLGLQDLDVSNCWTKVARLSRTLTFSMERARALQYAISGPAVNANGLGLALADLGSAGVGTQLDPATRHIEVGALWHLMGPLDGAGYRLSPEEDLLRGSVPGAPEGLILEAEVRHGAGGLMHAAGLDQSARVSAELKASDARAMLALQTLLNGNLTGARLLVPDHGPLEAFTELAKADRADVAYARTLGDGPTTMHLQAEVSTTLTALVSRRSETFGAGRVTPPLLAAPTRNLIPAFARQAE